MSESNRNDFVFSDDIFLINDKPVPKMLQSDEEYSIIVGGVAAQVAMMTLNSLLDYLKFMHQKNRQEDSGISSRQQISVDTPSVILPPFDSAKLDVNSGEPVIKFKEIEEKFQNLPRLPSNHEASALLEKLVCMVQGKLHQAICFHWKRQDHVAREYCHVYADWWWYVVYNAFLSFSCIMNQSSKTSDLQFQKQVVSDIIQKAFGKSRGGHRDYFKESPNEKQQANEASILTPESRKRAFQTLEASVITAPNSARSKLVSQIRFLVKSHNSVQFNISNLNRAIVAKLPVQDAARQKMERAISGTHEKLYESLSESAWNALKRYISDWQKSIPSPSKKTKS